MGLRVDVMHGGRPAKRRVLLRTVVKLAPWEVAHLFVWQMMWVYHREGHSAMPPAWVFVGMNAAWIAAAGYVVMVLATGRGPHDRAAGTVVVTVPR